MSSATEGIDLYLIHATLDPNSGSLIGFPPTIQGLPQDATIANLITLFGNLHSMGQVGDSLAPPAIDRMQFWAMDGTTLTRTQPLRGLPEPRVVILVAWNNEPAPVLPKHQACSIAESFFNYAREHDDNFVKFFGGKDVPVPDGTVDEGAYEVKVTFSFLADRIDVLVARAGTAHLSFALQMAPDAKLVGYGLETTFGAATVPPIGEFPTQLAEIAVALHKHLGEIDSLEFERARPIVNETNQALANSYIKAANIYPVNAWFVNVQLRFTPA